MSSRRDFITLLGSAAAAWPLAARAQQPEQMRRIGVATGTAADDPDGQARLRGFLQGLKQSGWTEGRNVRIDARWGAGDADLYRNAAELIALAPDVILASGDSTVGPLLRATRTGPIVFAQVADPVGGGFVDSLARPGGNATGFMNFEYSLCWRANTTACRRSWPTSCAVAFAAAPPAASPRGASWQPTTPPKLLKRRRVGMSRYLASRADEQNDEIGPAGFLPPLPKAEFPL
jgi:hypothetical protein